MKRREVAILNDALADLEAVRKFYDSQQRFSRCAKMRYDTYTIRQIIFSVRHEDR